MSTIIPFLNIRLWNQSCLCDDNDCVLNEDLPCKHAIIRPMMALNHLWSALVCVCSHHRASVGPMSYLQQQPVGGLC